MILSWIGSLDASVDLLRCSEKIIDGTGTWMLEDTKFRGWMNSSLPTPLWVYGGSGTGKTFLATHVVQHLQNQGDAGFGVVSYFFLDKSDASRCSLASVTASIISQILMQSQEISPAL